jgi:hypothetical protein
MQDNGYRIIKLKNGENIIARILETKKTTISLERPMQFKTVVFLDQNNTTNNSDIIVFKNWIDYTIDIVVEISIDGVLAISTPDPKLINCYEMEKYKEDTDPKNKPDELKEVTEEMLTHMMNNQQNPAKTPNIPPENINVTFNVPPEMAEEIIEMMAEAKSWEDMDDEDIEDEDIFPEVKLPKKKNKKKPNNSTPKQPPQKKNKKDTKNFGNDWTDWSPDPKDYI